MLLHREADDWREFAPLAAYSEDFEIENVTRRAAGRYRFESELEVISSYVVQATGLNNRRSNVGAYLRFFPTLRIEPRAMRTLS